MRVSIVTSALVAVFVGFGGTVAIILAAARSVGASDAETLSWVVALCLVMTVTSVFLSWRHKMPIITAWSTPGLALIAASTGTTMATAVGAFICAAILILLTAVIKPLGRLVNALPGPIASAMLAGILFQFVVPVFAALPVQPLLILPLIVVFLLVRLFNASFAVLAALGVGIILVFVTGLAGPLPDHVGLPKLLFIAPEWSLATLIGLGLPLYLVTMASQNLTGFAVLRADGYTPPVQSSLAVTGAASLVSAFAGASTSCLSAITAAICTGADCHPDPAKRWQAGTVYGLGYLVLAIFAMPVMALISAMPRELITAIAGLALIGPLTGSLAGAMKEPKLYGASVFTFAVTASGLNFYGIGAAFWGLAAGLIVYALERAAKR